MNSLGEKHIQTVYSKNRSENEPNVGRKIRSDGRIDVHVCSMSYSGANTLSPPGYQHFHPVPPSFGHDPFSFVITHVISACLKGIDSIFFIVRETRFPCLR